MEFLRLSLKKFVSFWLGIFRIFPIKKNRIFLLNDLSYTYGCNPKYICEYILKNAPDRFEIIYPLKKEDNTVDHRVKTVKPGTLSYFYYALTSRIFITNLGGVSYLPIRKKQTVINTWHAGGAYKKLGMAVTKHDFFYTLETKLNAKKTDYFLASNKCMEKYYPESLLLDKNKFLKTGIPRIDIFFTDYSSIREKVYQYYDIDRSKRIALYCPTFRSGDDFLKNQYEIRKIKFDYSRISNVIREKFNGDWIIAERAHPKVVKQEKETSNDIISFTEYPDMQELLCAVDLVITDYSSLIWDYSFTKKPCFVYADDIMEYERSRGFYTPVSEWPFPICISFDELLDNIRNFNQEEYEKRVKKHYDDLGSYERGTASEAVIKLIEIEINR